jgi:hypothetical protein
MGRPSKLKEKQWDEVRERVLRGEPVRAIAREYGITEGAIRQRVSTQADVIKDVARQIVQTEQALHALPVSAQVSAQRLADEIMAISTNLASAGKSGSIVARSVMEIAAKQVQKVNQDDPMESAEILQGVSALGRIANESSSIGMQMVKIVKESKEEGKDHGKTLAGPDWDSMLKRKPDVA